MAPRFLFITRKWSPAIGGMETYCVRLAERLGRTHDLQVIALAGRADGRPPSAIQLSIFPFTVLVRWLALRQKFDVVHLGDMAVWPLALLVPFLSPSAQIVISAHGTDISYGARGGIKGTLYSGYQRLGSWLLRNARIIANSQATANACSENGWRNISVVALATDLRSAPAPDYAKHTILFAGRLIKQKGLAWFVDNVLPRLPQPIEVQVAGMPTDPQEAQALQDPRVHYLGGLDQTDLVQRYAGALCVIVPNIDLSNGEFEGFGLVACEAACSGGLVIAARTGGLVSAVIDRKTGILVDAGNPQAWVDTIREITGWSDAERAAFLSGSQHHAQVHFNWDRVASQTLEVYARSHTEAEFV